MKNVFIHLTAEQYSAIWGHLIADGPGLESAGFLFAKHQVKGNAHFFEHLEWHPVPSDGFETRSDYHFELTDQTRAMVVKQAHDLGASIVEFHSHSGPRPASFSPSDNLGLLDFVPHVWWRLQGKPYLALVVTESDFDGLAWVTGPKVPQRLTGLVVDGISYKPTHLSSLELEYDERQAV